MKMIAVDDEKHALLSLQRALHSVASDADVCCFTSAEEALQYARMNQVDVAFLDIEMREMNGLLLARYLKDIYGKTNIIFVTGYSSYMGDAFALYASGYVLKPINPERVEQELNHLRNPVKHKVKGVRIQCFGNFEVFVDEKPVHFGRTKSKELLAYLVDRKGVGVSKKELASVLWEDEAYTHSLQSHIFVLITSVIDTLEKAGAYHFVIKRRGVYSVDTSKFICDYYNYEKGDVSAVNSYQGEYMANYSWAEFKVGYLNDKAKE